MKDACLHIFAKAPEPGCAKTRLIPALGAAGAARLAQELTLQTLRTAAAWGIGQIELWCSPDCAHPFFARCAAEFGVILQAQQGEDLGERMFFAFAASLSCRPYAVLIGTDCPTLDATDFHDTMNALRNGFDAVIAPAEDGGYVLLGLSRVEPRLFEGIDWGTERVLSQTRARLRESGYRWCELREHADIDRPEDLNRLFGEYPHWRHCLHEEHET
ncbi:TIGR04282 family arsenosugar biosynthesis glycosyltransferase [Methylocaldum sp.]|uniref:TIGR04282 family arsenosugar biosynthesis glycosyltransferase n=1 Tax=Methylocaldum sp. TaxID=1969727 RepID=UPI002D354B6D|nr:TIGR04282 family arsenosugar biosynthesis glycosyltransferase [Methylocaldum sp.]HYE37362.1 TIGR04282 family arsenosugar biosynthesis glycosyltransferase [Methylocaldum sp.]